MNTARRLVPAAALTVAALAGVGAFLTLPAPRPALAVAAQDAKSYKIDPVHTTVVFSAMYGTIAPFYGQFTDYKGTVAYDGQSPRSLKVDVEIPVDSLDTHNDVRNGHLKSPDWFNAREYPTVRFVSTGVEGTGGDMTLKGDLTLHGVTKPVTAKIDHLGVQAFGGPRGTRVGLGCAFVVKRSDFGVTQMLGDTGIGDEITLMVGLQGTAQ